MKEGKKQIINRYGEKSDFKPSMIKTSLMEETSLLENEIDNVVTRVSNQIRKLERDNIFTSEIRDMVKSSLLKNEEKNAYEYDTISIGVNEIDNLITDGCSDNANQSKNPETIHKYIADSISKQYCIKRMPEDIRKAYLESFLHYHDLEYEQERGNNCLMSDLRFFIKNGVKLDGNGRNTSTATPPNHLSTLINHAGQILNASQQNMSGGQGYGYFNIFLAPFCKGLTYNEIKSNIQAFVFNLNMSYSSRGGQVCFSSINLELGVPSFLKNEPAYAHGGHINGVYGDYENEAELVLNAFIEVLRDGSPDGKPHMFPNTVFILRDEFMNKDSLLLDIHTLISQIGTPYLANADLDAKDGAISIMGCRTMLSTKFTGDWELDTLRCGNLAYCTLNLPLIFNKAKKHYHNNWKKSLNEYLEIATKHLLYRREILERNLFENKNLEFLTQKDKETGEMYFRYENSSLAYGVNGLNESIQCILPGHTLLDEEGYDFGITVLEYIKEYADKMRKKYTFRFSVFQTPAESTSYKFGQANQKQDIHVEGTKETPYTTNSTHIPVSSNIDLINKIDKEVPFHSLTPAGSILHLWLGEKANPKALLDLTRIIKKKGGRFWAFTNDYSHCYDCNSSANGIIRKCDVCKSENIEHYSRITGYYQRICIDNLNQGWNPGKKQELKDRKKDIVE